MERYEQMRQQTWTDKKVLQALWIVVKMLTTLGRAMTHLINLQYSRRTKAESSHSNKLLVNGKMYLWPCCTTGILRKLTHPSIPYILQLFLFSVTGAASPSMQCCSDRSRLSQCVAYCTYLQSSPDLHVFGLRNGRQELGLGGWVRVGPKCLCFLLFSHFSFQHYV